MARSSNQRVERVMAEMSNAKDATVAIAVELFASIDVITASMLGISLANTTTNDLVSD